MCGTYVYVSKRPAQAHTMHHTLLPLHMSVWYSVPDVLHSTPGVMRVYWRCYTRILLCVTQGWKLPVPWYHVIYGGVTYDIYVIYMYYVSINYMSCCSLPTNWHTYTSPAINIKLIYIVSIGSTVTSGAQLLFTGAQLRPPCSRLSGTLLPTSPLGRMGPWLPAVVTIGWLVLTLLVNCKRYFLWTLLRLLQFSILLRSEEGCCEYPNQGYQPRIDTLEQCNQLFQDFHWKEK